MPGIMSRGPSRTALSEWQVQGEIAHVLMPLAAFFGLKSGTRPTLAFSLSILPGTWMGDVMGCGMLVGFAGLVPPQGLGQDSKKCRF